MKGLEGLIGQTLGQYRIVEQIGAGGMATVFKAYQPGLDRYVAVKVLPPLHADQPGFNERFVREARAIAKLHHPNILPVYDFGQERDYSFIVMRYVEGARTLREVMKQPLGLATAADLIGQVAAALDHAHARKIIHRDVKPANVLMDGDWALLSDFGLARMTEATVQLTGSGVGVGTPAYMSPEQGQALPVDHRTDVYSLGIILFEMLTGRIPHNAETPFAIILKRMSEPLPLPRSLNPVIPESVERVILKALAREPGDRFASAGEMAAALRQAVAEHPAEVPPVEALPVEASPVVTLPVEPPPGPARASAPMVAALTAVSTAIARLPVGALLKRLRQPLGWLLRTAGIFLVAFVAIVVVLLVLGSFGASALIERAIAGSDWGKIYPGVDITVVETEAQQYVMEAAQLSLPGSVEDVGLDFAPPDQINVQAAVFGKEMSIGCTLTSVNGIVDFEIERLGGVRLYLVGSILSSGINRGLKTVMEERSLVVEKLAIGENSLTIRHKSGIVGATETPTGATETPTAGTFTATTTPRPSPTPTAAISSDPMLYDNFNDPADDGDYDKDRWRIWSDPPNHIAQQDGVMMFTHQGKPERNTNLAANEYHNFSLDRPTFFEARLMLDSEANAGSVQLQMRADLADGEAWVAGCNILNTEGKAWAGCGDTPLPEQEERSFSSEWTSVQFGSWHTVRMEVNPATMTFSYFVDGRSVGSHVPLDADQLKKARFTLIIGIWGPSVGALTGYVDDVRIGPLPAAGASSVSESTSVNTSTSLPDFVRSGAREIYSLADIVPLLDTVEKLHLFMKNNMRYVPELKAVKGVLSSLNHLPAGWR